jgi:hypothetical protein
MSHIVKIKTDMSNLEVLKAACEHLGLSYSLSSTAKLYSGTSPTGTVINLPGWRYPIVVSPDGEVHYDNYGGEWGKIRELEKLRQTYMSTTLEELISLSGMTVESSFNQQGQLVMIVEEGW